MNTTAYRLLLTLLAIWQAKAQGSERSAGSEYANNEPSLITALSASAVSPIISVEETGNKVSDETALPITHAEFTSTDALYILETSINVTRRIDDHDDVNNSLHSTEDTLTVASGEANVSPTATTLRSFFIFLDSLNKKESSPFLNTATRSSIAGETSPTWVNRIRNFNISSGAANISSSSAAASTAVVRTTGISVRTAKGSHHTLSNDLATSTAANGMAIPKNATDGAEMNGSMGQMSIVVIVCASLAAAAAVSTVVAMAVCCFRNRCRRKSNSEKRRGPSRLSVLWPRVRHSHWMTSFHDRVLPPRQQPVEMVENSLYQATQPFQPGSPTIDSRCSLSLGRSTQYGKTFSD